MQKKCKDDYSTTFETFDEMKEYHVQQSKETEWKRCDVRAIHVEPLSKDSMLYMNPGRFAGDTTQEAVIDTANNLGLAIRIGSEIRPVRDTAYKSLLDRAKISGTALPKLKKQSLAGILNECLAVHNSKALMLIRDEKISAVHSGDESDYSVLPIDELLGVLKESIDKRFPGNLFNKGYCDHSIASATWIFPNQRKALLGTYVKYLEENGKKKLADKLVPGIRFTTSDTGIASAKVSALIMGTQMPIHIGSCLSVDHRRNTKISDFEEVLNQLFAQFGETVKKLEELTRIHLAYPVNTMTRICKKMSMPKNAAVEAIAMFEMAHGNNPATAHDVFLAMQEIMFTAKSEGASAAKLLNLEESMARMMAFRWSDYDLPKAVSY